MTKGARCSGSTAAFDAAGAGSIPAAPWEPGFCSTCGTTNPADYQECGGEACFWVRLIDPSEEPRRAA